MTKYRLPKETKDYMVGHLYNELHEKSSLLTSGNTELIISAYRYVANLYMLGAVPAMNIMLQEPVGDELWDLISFNWNNRISIEMGHLEIAVSPNFINVNAAGKRPFVFEGEPVTKTPDTRMSEWDYCGKELSMWLNLESFMNPIHYLCPTLPVYSQDGELTG